jgi:FtsH-binding integral membrane protein
MRLDTRAFAIAAGTTAAVLFTLCALAVAIAPGATTAFFGYLVHMDLSALPRTLTFASFIGGLICWTAGTALTFGLAATIYNRLIRVGSVAPAAGHQEPAAQRA